MQARLHPLRVPPLQRGSGEDSVRQALRQRQAHPRLHRAGPQGELIMMVIVMGGGTLYDGR